MTATVESSTISTAHMRPFAEPSGRVSTTHSSPSVKDEYEATLARLREETRSVFARLRANGAAVARTVRMGVGGDGGARFEADVKPGADAKVTSQTKACDGVETVAGVKVAVREKRGVRFADGGDGRKNRTGQVEISELALRSKQQTRQLQSQVEDGMVREANNSPAYISNSQNVRPPTLPYSPVASPITHTPPTVALSSASAGPPPSPPSSPVAVESVPDSSTKTASYSSSSPIHRAPLHSSLRHTIPSRHISSRPGMEAARAAVLASPLLSLPDAYFASLRAFRASNASLVKGDPGADMPLVGNKKEGGTAVRDEGKDEIMREEEEEELWYTSGHFRMSTRLLPTPTSAPTSYPTQVQPSATKPESASGRSPVRSGGTKMHPQTRQADDVDRVSACEDDWQPPFGTISHPLPSATSRSPVGPHKMARSVPLPTSVRKKELPASKEGGAEMQKRESVGPVRVTVPSTVPADPPVRYKAHRRVSFDPGERVGLESHLHASYAYPFRATGAKRAERVSLAAEIGQDGDKGRTGALGGVKGDWKEWRAEW